MGSFGIPAPTAVVVASGTSTNSGNYSISSDGGFTYNPPPGFEGTDTFTYTATNGNGTQNGTVSITVSGMIWFVDNGAVVNGDGRLISPFNCLTGAGCLSASAHGAGDNIFLYTGTGNYTGGITLLNNERLIGQGATASLQTITGLTPPVFSDSLPLTGGTRPTITTTAAATNGLNLASGNTLRGFNFGNATGIALSGSSFGTLTLSEVAVNTNNAGLSLTTGTANATFTSFTSTGGTNNINLSSVAGTTTFGGGALSGASGTAFAVSGGTVSTTYSGGISQTNN